MSEQTRELEIQTRAASFAPATVVEEARTVELVWTTGATVRRYGWDGPYDEVLDVSAEAIDLGRLNTGAPFLLDHRNSTAMQIGVVEKAWIDGNEGRAIVRISKRAEADGVWQDIKDGILRNISVGYRIHKLQITEGANGEVPEYRALRWEPLEISLVSVPADSGAGMRSNDTVKNTVEIIRASTEAEQTAGEPDKTEEARASEENTETEPQEARQMAEVNIEQARDEAIKAERARVAEIRKLVTRTGIDSAVADDLIERGVDLDAARSAVIDAVAAKAEATRTSNVSAGGDQTLDNPDFKRTAMEDAMVARALGKAPEGAAKEFSGIGFVGVARELTGLGRANASDVITRAMQATTDFPVILANVGNKALLETYRLAVPTYQSFALKRDLNDFKAHSFVSLGEFATLTEKTETGDYADSTIGEKGESFAAKELGRIFHVSRRLLVNDDLNALGDIARRAATAARLTENRTVYGVLKSNPVLSDGTAVFHASRNNVIASGNGGAPSIETVAAARIAIRKQRSVDGVPLNISGKYLVVGPDNELAARKVVASVTPTSVDDINPFSGQFEVVVDAELENEWFLLADPMIAPTIAYGYVQGSGPFFKTETKFESQSVKFLMALDFGAGFVDYRGAFRNAGE